MCVVLCHSFLLNRTFNGWDLNYNKDTGGWFRLREGPMLQGFQKAERPDGGFGPCPGVKHGIRFWRREETPVPGLVTNALPVIFGEGELKSITPGISAEPPESRRSFE